MLEMSVAAAEVVGMTVPPAEAVGPPVPSSSATGAIISVSAAADMATSATSAVTSATSAAGVATSAGGNVSADFGGVVSAVSADFAARWLLTRPPEGKRAGREGALGCCVK